MGCDICGVAQVWGGPRATEHTKEMPPAEEAGLLNALNIPHRREVAVSGYTVQPRLSKLKVK